MIKGFNHVGISVVDLQISIEFYREILGMEVVDQIEFGGAQDESILGLPGASGKAAMMRSASLQIELFEFAYPPPKTKNIRYPVSDHGLSHFCVEVLDIDAEYRRLKAAGVHFHCPPLHFSDGSSGTYARDPDGNVFELLELAKS